MAPPGAAKREVAEVGLELLYLELVKLCPQRPVLDAMGVQVGHQLAERYVTVAPEHTPVWSREHVTPHGHRPKSGFHQHQQQLGQRQTSAQGRVEAPTLCCFIWDGRIRRYTADRTRFSDSLEVIKFICKEFWSEVFKKQIDNLKTNRHRVRAASLTHPLLCGLISLERQQQPAAEATNGRVNGVRVCT